MRDFTPFSLLRLGKYQQAYDFIKWYETTEDDAAYDWRDMASKFGENDMLCSVDYEQGDPSNLNWRGRDYSSTKEKVSTSLLANTSIISS